MATKVTPEGNGGTMLAAHVTQWCAVGSVPDNVLFGNVPAPPAPKRAEVVVSVKAASINVDDVALLQNTGGGGWLYHARTPSVAAPLVGGCDYAGVVLACGQDCKRLKVGDRVVGIIKVAEQHAGTWAEQTLALEGDVCLIEDDSISFVDAAGVAMGAFVDFDMIKKADKVLSAGGCRCLVLGASGALGTVMLQMLRKYKGHVTAVCSGANTETVLRMGANEAIDYTKQPFGEQLAAAEKFNVVFDFVGGMEVQRGAEPLMEKNGLYITAVGPRQNVGDRQLTCCEFFGSACTIVSKSLCSCGSKFKYLMSGSYPPLTAEIWKSAVIESSARAAIAEEVPFAEAPIREALRRAASHHPGGRLVMNLERRS